MTPVRMHEDELEFDVSVVRALVERDTPELAGCRLRELGETGSTNRLFRLGEDHVVRMPRQPGGSERIRIEQRWSPHVARDLPTAVPEIVAVGEPGFGYPERWAVARWLPGRTPDRTQLRSADELAGDLARTVRAFGEIPVPDEALRDDALRWYRGGSLRAVDEEFRGCLERCSELPGIDLDVDACLQVWTDAVTLPDADAQLRWLHGDLLAENLLVDDRGRLSAVLDLGALSIGHPSADLVVAWDVLDPVGRTVFQRVVDVDEQEWLRGRAWALLIAVITFPYYWHTMPGRCRSRLRLAQAVLDDARRNLTPDIID